MSQYSVTPNALEIFQKEMNKKIDDFIATGESIDELIKAISNLECEHEFFKMMKPFIIGLIKIKGTR